MSHNNKKTLYTVIGVVAVAAIIFGLYSYAGQESFIRTVLSGLTLGSLFFLVAAGLTLIFGLMDVLNFAHGSMFMLGAYIGWQFYTNPTFIFGVLPLLLAFAAGILLVPLFKPKLVRLELSDVWQKRLPKLMYLAALIVGGIALWKFDVIGLADTAMVAAVTTSANPLAELSAQEPLLRFMWRPLLLMVSGALVAVGVSRPGDRTEITAPEPLKKRLILLIVLVILTIVFTLVRENASEAVLLMNGNLRFLLAIITATGFGFLLGALIEITMIRPLYVRSFFIVLMTLGLSYVLRELVQVLWDPLAYQMVRPPLFAQPGRANTIAEWLMNGSSTISIVGVTFPTYRLFVIALGFVMFIFVTVLMTRSRLGMVIRAGVQDPQMVEALGINVKSVFTLVFALGVALAALGGIGAAPFLPVQPGMGDQYQMQGFITVVIGGMGSYVGAFVGAIILGMARAFGDYFALKWQLSPTIAEASTVIIMIVVLLLRPQGLFGKKD
ncbi:MAG: branched-chain amino acid ABC transporter permease [Anaerolineaceae bacterium]|jgi:branched-chain amino acid transport system permease protein|nr:branched-chain amino acid ABC transporter permease [Anaerolineaceae bacterium]MDD4043141.1 branched-chain amino acid ABC transporter permease [Anaerolineaceae bacterium]